MRKRYQVPSIRVKTIDMEALMDIVSVPSKDSGMPVNNNPDAGNGGTGPLAKPSPWEGSADGDDAQHINVWGD